jgi:hemerythrin
VIVGEHDVIVRVMAQVEQAVADRRGADVVAPLLSVLAEYSQEHFATGERVLRRYGYGRVDSLRHKRMLRRIPALQERLCRGSSRDRAEVVGFLRRLSEKLGYRERPNPGTPLSESPWQV